MLIGQVITNVSLPTRTAGRVFRMTKSLASAPINNKYAVPTVMLLLRAEMFVSYLLG